MAVGTYLGAIGSGRKVTVTRSTDDALGSATAGIVFDTTADEFDVIKTLRACIRAFDRARSKVAKISSISVTGTSLD